MCQSQNFGFWCQLFQYKQYRDVKVELVEIFTNAPVKGWLLEEVRTMLNQIRKERNKLAHHKPVIFRRRKSRVSFYKIDLIIKQVKLLTEWLGITTEIYSEHLLLIDEQKKVIQQLLPNKK
jgi:hypothetical protein